MAVYEFTCPACGERFEVTAPMAEYDHLKEQPPQCPKCGERHTHQAVAQFVCKTPSGY
jgi:putative FmdB family regulatory protein